MEPKKIYNNLLAKKLIEEFEKRNIKGYYCETKQDALKKVLEIIPKNSTVACGSSKTLLEIGLYDKLKSGGYNYLDRDKIEDESLKEKLAIDAFNADYYLMSANAITLAGEMVNIDGYGNRVAALIFGPKNVIVVTGLNKVEPDLDTAIKRVKSYAALLTQLIFEQDFTSYNDLSKAADDICCQTVITDKSWIKDRIKVILVDEDLGF